MDVQEVRKHRLTLDYYRHTRSCEHNDSWL